MSEANPVKVKEN